VEADHDGYSPDVHRRAVLRNSSELWFVADHFLGQGDHELAIRWHLDPAWQLRHSDAGSVGVHHADGPWAAIASTATRLAESAEFGWCAPVYGQHRQALTLTATEKKSAPFSVITVVAAGASPRVLSLEKVPVAVDGVDSSHRIGVVGVYAHRRFVALFGTETIDTAPQTRPLQALELDGSVLHTDARIAVLGLSITHEPEFLTLVDATQARWTGPGSFSIGRFTSAADLHLDRDAVSRLSVKSESKSPSADRMEPTTCAE